jgi:hypothetical protein
MRYLREGFGGQGADLHTDFDLLPLQQSSRAFREFIRPKG